MWRMIGRLSKGLSLPLFFAGVATGYLAKELGPKLFKEARPLLKDLLRCCIDLSEKAKLCGAVAWEKAEDLYAEVKAEVDQEKLEKEKQSKKKEH